MLVIVIVLILTNVSRTSGQNGTRKMTEVQRKDLADNVTIALDNLFDNYDKNIRPDHGGPPLFIGVSIQVLSIGPVSEKEMEFAFDCYFRQNWTDSRLKFDVALEKISLNALTFLERVWKPDTYFRNGRRSHLHKLTVPNKLVRLSRKGNIMVSQRLTIRVKCHMYLRKFPMDTQACPVHIGSLGYNKDNVAYHWVDMTLTGKNTTSQYKLNDLYKNVRNASSSSFKFSGEYTILNTHFILERLQGFYILQIYLPCIMTVVLSWVSFWINKESPPARVALGVMTVLTMSTLGLGGQGGYRGDLPRVSYSTALDLYIVVSFGYVFASLVEYAVINFVHIIYVRQMQYEAHRDKDPNRKTSRKISGLNMLSFAFAAVPSMKRVMPQGTPERKSTIESDDSDDPSLSLANTGLGDGECNFPRPATETESDTDIDEQDELSNLQSNKYDSSDDDVTPEPDLAVRRRQNQKVSFEMKTIQATRNISNRKRSSVASRKSLPKLNLTTSTIVDRVDDLAKVFFPLTYIIFNIFYWTFFLYLIPDEIIKDLIMEYGEDRILINK